jgi:biotin carboxyl carrier protein
MVEELKERIDELAALMEEFALSEAQLKGADWRISFRKKRRPTVVSESESYQEETELLSTALISVPEPVESKPMGLPVSSPMNGIYYSAPTPSSPPFVKPGESVMAGQVVGLIEAMKVFNEIVAPVSGTVDRVMVENGTLVQPGEPLLYIV